MFQSYGRKKRSINDNSIGDDDTQERNIEETLSAIIRVLAEGEQPAELEMPPQPNNSYRSTYTN